MLAFATVSSAISNFRGRSHTDVTPESDFSWTYAEPDLWPVSCKHGPQSPKAFVDFKNSTAEKEKLLFQYRPIVNNIDIVHDGKSISLTLPKMHGGFGLGETFSQLTAESEVFGFWQLAVHHPSEHLFDGKEVPVEVQLYHTRVKSDACRQGIIAIGFDTKHRTSTPNMTKMPHDGFLETLSTVIPRQEGKSTTNGAILDVSELFLEPVGDGTFVDASFVRYGGSVSLPPCDSADVFVRTVAIEAPFQAVEKIKDTLVSNARKREGAPVETRLYKSENCAGQIPPTVTLKSDETPLVRGAAKDISCVDASTIVKKFPSLHLGELSKEKNPNDMILYCASVIAAMAEEEAAKNAYDAVKAEKASTCREAAAKSATVKESMSAEDQLKQSEANTLSITCEEKTLAAKAQKEMYESVRDARKKVDIAAKEQMQIAIDISDSNDRPESPMAKQNTFKCNDNWPFGSAADTTASESADGMMGKVVGNPRVASHTA